MTFDLINTAVLPSMLAIAIGFTLDLIFGDPRWMPHPVCLIGNMITWGEKHIRKTFPKTAGGELAGGILLGIVIVLIQTYYQSQLPTCTWPAGILVLVGLIITAIAFTTACDDE